jgi:hypothetical protein
MVIKSKKRGREEAGKDVEEKHAEKAAGKN